MRVRWFAVTALVWSSFALGQTQGAESGPLLNHLEGNWILKGTIAGKQTTHDVQAHWILNHEYMLVHEISRDKNQQGKPAYEAEILVSWDQRTSEYACLWLDSTEGGALTSQVTCRAKPSPHAIPFVFTISGSDAIHTTFTYNEGHDTWQWLIENVDAGTSRLFADLELSRAK